MNQAPIPAKTEFVIAILGTIIIDRCAFFSALTVLDSTLHGRIRIIRIALRSAFILADMIMNSAGRPAM
jgi:hypothetical protein